MYTVIRFQCADSLTTIQELGDVIGHFPSIGFDGPDKGNAKRISCTVATDDDWETHLASIERFLVEGAELVKWANHRNVAVSFDMAIEPEDVNGFLGSFSIPPDVTRKIGEMRIGLTISVYR